MAIQYDKAIKEAIGYSIECNTLDQDYWDLNEVNYRRINSESSVNFLFNSPLTFPSFETETRSKTDTTPKTRTTFLSSNPFI